MNNLNIPIYNAIKKYVSLNPIPFHMPGHKLGKGIPCEVLKNLPLMDITEIPGADNLHYPEGIIKEAQLLASEAFGADSTFFLVNGSTSGIHAMIMAMCRPGDQLIVSRDCHRSVITGMMLAGARPVYINPEFNQDFGIPTAINPHVLEKALASNPDAVGVLITRPNYYGVCSDIKRIAEIVHKYGKVLAVDEAHGAHLRFSERLPLCALDGGADICVQSAHKTLPALTQGSYLHVKNGRIDMDRLREMLHMLQTSSPSYIIMAMLDIARDIMDRCGREYFSEIFDNLGRIHSQTDSDRLRWLCSKDIVRGDKDPTRLVINVKKLGLTGYEAGKILREKYNIFIEMSDMSNIVLIITIADQYENFERLYLGLEGLSKYSKYSTQNKIFSQSIVYQPNISMQAIELKDVLNLKATNAKLFRAEGRVSKDMITPYPPGIPLICPGEKITKEAIEYISELISKGSQILRLLKSIQHNLVALLMSSAVNFEPVQSFYLHLKLDKPYALST
jgi:lysine decarboxylase